MPIYDNEPWWFQATSSDVQIRSWPVARPWLEGNCEPVWPQAAHRRPSRTKIFNVGKAGNYLPLGSTDIDAEKPYFTRKMICKWWVNSTSMWVYRRVCGFHQWNWHFQPNRIKPGPPLMGWSICQTGQCSAAQVDKNEHGSAQNGVILHESPSHPIVCQCLSYNNIFTHLNGTLPHFPYVFPKIFQVVPMFFHHHWGIPHDLMQSRHLPLGMRLFGWRLENLHLVARPFGD